MHTAHVVLDVIGEVVASNLDALVADDSAKGDDGNFSCAAAYVHNHVAFRRKHIKTNTECSSHRLKNHIYVPATGMLGGVTDSPDFNF